MGRGPGRPPKRGWRGRFLLALFETGSKVKAARRARVARSTVIAWELADPVFRQAAARAKRQASIERAARRYNENPSMPNCLAYLAAVRPAEYGWAVKRRARSNPRNSALPSEEATLAYLREMLSTQEAKTGQDHP